VSIICGAMAVAVGLGNGGISLSAIIVITSMLITALMIGRAGLELIRLPVTTGFRPFADLIVGTSIMSLTMLFVCVASVTSTGIVFFALLAVGIVAAVYNSQCWTKADLATPADLLILAAICFSAVAWSWEAIQAVPRMRATGVFHAWSDFFIHAGEIAQFAHFSSLNGTSLFASDAALPLYHYASYMLPAALCSLAGIPALVVATAFWTPFGFVLLGLGAYGLGSVLGGRLCGTASAAMLLAVPSASHYGLENPYFDFHWLLQISPTGSYAIALSLVALGLIVLGLQNRSGRAYWAAAALTLCVFEIRVHLFVLLAGIGVLLLAVFWRPRRRSTFYGAWAAFTVMSVCMLFVSELIPRAPHLLSGSHQTLGFLRLAHDMQESAYAGLYETIVRNVPESLAVVLGLVLLLLAAFGALVPCYLLGSWWLWRNKTLTRDAWIPLYSVTVYFSIILVFPSTDAEPDEFYHRPFVLVYAILGIWCVRIAMTMVGRGLPAVMCRVLPIALIISICVIPFLFNRNVQISRNTWAGQLSRNILPRGLLAAADYVRERALPGDVVATPESELSASFVGLSDRAAFLPGSTFLVIQSGLSDEQLAIRRTIFAELTHAADSDTFMRIARSHRIKWVVAFPGTLLSPAASAMSVMEAGGFHVIAADAK
jgi:hypothetical protein